MSRVIYTIGYGAAPRGPGLTTGELASLVQRLDVTLVDVRGRPTSRVAGFGGRQLGALLGKRYAWMGDSLGGLHHLANARAKWPGGLRRMLDAVERPLMLCQCWAPAGCHRHQLALAMQDVAPRARVAHIFEREVIDADELQRSIDDDDDYTCHFWKTYGELRDAAEHEG